MKDTKLNQEWGSDLVFWSACVKFLIQTGIDFASILTWVILFPLYIYYMYVDFSAASYTGTAWWTDYSYYNGFTTNMSNENLF